jgi:uncharacterized membrane-anchored protein
MFRQALDALPADLRCRVAAMVRDARHHAADWLDQALDIRHDSHSVWHHRAPAVAIVPGVDVRRTGMDE